MKKLCFVFALAFGVASKQVVSQVPSQLSTNVSAPLKFSELIDIEMTPTWTRQNARLRVQNLSNGRVVLLNWIEQEGIELSQLRPLVDSLSESWVPQFSVLEGVRRSDENFRRSERNDANLEERGTYRPGQALGYSGGIETTWLPLGFKKAAVDGVGYRLTLSPYIRTRILSNEQIERRLDLIEDIELRKLFAIAWRALELQKFDLAEDAFNALILKRPIQELRLRAQAFMGRAIAVYNQRECKDQVRLDLQEADRDPVHQIDVTFYRALCVVADRRWLEAENLFRQLASSRHPLYGDTSRFYMGVIAEETERWDEAETHYLDVIDFSADERLVSASKSRLRNVRALREHYSLEHALFSGGINTSLTHETNVVSLPQDLDPSALGLSNAASAVVGALAFASLNPPWSPKLSHTIDYLFYLNKNLRNELSADYDSLVHDLGTSFSYVPNGRWQHQWTASFSSIRTGPVGSSSESLRGHSAQYQMRINSYRSTKNIVQTWETTFRFANVIQKSVPSSAAFRSSAETVGVDFQLSELRSAPHSYGPTAVVEYRPARGIEVSLWRLGGGIFWNYNFQSSNWSARQSLNFDFRNYYQSSGDRKDYQLSYSGSLTYQMGANYSFAILLRSALNVSSLPLEYQYQAHSAGMSLSAFF